MPNSLMPHCHYTVLAMLRGDLDSLDPPIRGVLNGKVLDAYSDDSPDNWKPFGDDVPICELVESAGTPLRIRFESHSQEFVHDPDSQALFRLFVVTDLYIIDCLSLEHPRIADLAKKIEFAVHRNAAFLVPFDFGDELRRRMHDTWKRRLPLLDFARGPSDDLNAWRNKYIFHVSFRDDLKQHLTTVLEDLESIRRARQVLEPSQPTFSARQRMNQYLDQQGISQGLAVCRSETLYQ